MHFQISIRLPSPTFFLIYSFNNRPSRIHANALPWTNIHPSKQAPCPSRIDYLACGHHTPKHLVPQKARLKTTRFCQCMLNRSAKSRVADMRLCWNSEFLSVVRVWNLGRFQPIIPQLTYTLHSVRICSLAVLTTYNLPLIYHFTNRTLKELYRVLAPSPPPPPPFTLHPSPKMHYN